MDMAAMQEALEAQYSFFGGDRDEWIRYLNRSDLPGNMWRYLEKSEIAATAAKHPGSVSSLAAEWRKRGSADNLLRQAALCT